ncbi:hypothetical protein EV421DRAFT_1910785 [Armillaria borealis]|uniref:HNH nuclease domain-containing protein n=1 Tax=Armillaria borealis TaxID=47425 RepID=A0AA39MG78_9AGAR|nr:hypothetical protein EV421DRAFT_1910785 [Armillaria borealis]
MAITVLKRQQHICPLTAFGHRDHYASLSDDPDLDLAEIENSHIFKRAPSSSKVQSRSHLDLISSHLIIPRHGTFDNAKDSYEYAMTTWDIRIVPTVDDASNGIGFEHYCHSAFNRFLFSLHPTDAPNEYTIQLHRPSLKLVFTFPPVGGREHRVIFKDYSNSDPPIPLPNPAYLRLHAAIAGILDMGGAAEVMDEFEDKHGETGSNLLAQSDYKFEDVLSWIGFENSRMVPVH